MPKMFCVMFNGTLATLTGSMRPMPCGPLVRLTGALRLFKKMRMISPKPSVTMAR